MFSGIIKNIGYVKSIKSSKNGKKIGIKTNVKVSKKDIGASINCSGVCLTLEKIIKKTLFFYLSKETIKISTFKKIKVNDIINIEHALKFGDKISGHFVQGHVDTTSRLKKRATIGKSCYLYFSINKKYKKFLIYKGSVAINGVSLTIAKIFKNNFLVVVIPHTIKLTNLKNIKKDDIVNVEIDIVSKYIKKLN